MLLQVSGEETIVSKLSKGKTFSAILTPHRSMSSRGFTILMTLLAAISLIAGFAFVSLGAWPVLGFFGLDILAIYWAFKCNYRAARLAEYVHLEDNELLIRRISPSGREARWTFNPYWVRLVRDDDEDGCARLALTSHGKTLVVGAFLGREARARFAEAFGAALATHRS